MRETREALAEVGCTEVAETVRSALALTGIDPGTMGDEERERCLNSLTEEDLRGLQAADWAFYDAYEKSMVLCRRYALEHGLI
jgi:hypothetical protein